MHFTQREQDKLITVVAAEITRRRRTRGLKLDYPGALALISDELLEGARDSKTVADLMSYGKQVLNKDNVVEGADSMLIDIEIEVASPNGAKLTTIRHLAV